MRQETTCATPLLTKSLSATYSADRRNQSAAERAYLDPVGYAAAEAIRRISNEESISAMFGIDRTRI